ncbi:phosphonate C-P lyase system protein PhnH [Pseudooceanicola sp. HF7]|uniref:phosphonate C-P lyase system protein PhnH n=1 Tax=Pseudooceanicola sp. HF7 TaxID=2721560 RepID=UPI0014320220|nr:phosphonate C-P lyase system protein PhnH [Pseudooceanicola sp. HF7]NIZ10036.1 phosphonate C-P lyase system protein PhnH [Pseudooceanicola sp. HF7]
MPAVPQPSAFESRCNATYDALMWALSRPGLPRDLPPFDPDDLPAGLAHPAHAALIDALIDRECTVHCENPELARHAARSGAAPGTPRTADHLFLDGLATPDLLGDLRQGSDLHPEDGATLVLPARLGQGAPLRLSGPGVDGTLDVRLAGLPEGFWQTRARIMRYPMGFEVFLTDGARVLGLPRSTRVEVL